MYFHYALGSDYLYVVVNPSAPIALGHDLEGDWRVTVDIKGDGGVFGIGITHPGERPWPIRALLTRYPFDVNESFFLVTLSERYQLFRFG